MLIIRITVWLLLFFMISCDNPQNSVASNIENDASFEWLDSITNQFEEGNIEGSLRDAEAYTRLYPNADYGFNLLGTIYLAAEKDSLAKKTIEKALDLNPYNHGALTNYGIILDKIGKYIEAEKYYKKAIQIKPDFPQVYSNFMGNRIAVKEYEEARIYGEKSVSLLNANGDKGLLCAIYHKLGFYDKRDSLYQELQELKYENIKRLEEIIFENKSKGE